MTRASSVVQARHDTNKQASIILNRIARERAAYEDARADPLRGLKRAVQAAGSALSCATAAGAMTGDNADALTRAMRAYARSAAASLTGASDG
ncbi:MAG: hypothetical protein JWO83_4051 [Caulobacteraceae bacterium]|nr:hypothetical protein [Caulobacteraceae bacterium]